MDRKYAIWIVVGLAIGALFGIIADNIFVFALGGVFLGWFVAAILAQRDKTPADKQ